MKRRILLVEDEESLVLALRDRLHSEGYDVDVAGDGDAAFDRAASNAFDLILLDVALPKRSGFDVCRDLRARRADSGAHAHRARPGHRPRPRTQARRG